MYRATQPTSDWGPVYDKQQSGDKKTNDSSNQLDTLSFSDPIQLKINYQSRSNNHINMGFLSDYQDTKL